MFHHVTVLKHEAVEGLAIKPSGCYVDCTLGGAGHSSLILESLDATGKLIAFDQDEQAIQHAESLFANRSEQVKLVNSNFRHLQDRLQELGITEVDGVLFDLGVSSPQLDEAERGFSYQQDAELDMRMDRSASLTAEQIVNNWDEQEIARILFEYGEEKFARKIARHIVRAREQERIRTTARLAELIKEAIPAAARRSGPHPAKRSFQAIRIAVNDELGALADALEAALRVLRPGGRISVITFHSLEDRIVKQFFAKNTERCTCPPDFPMCVCNNKGELRTINRKPIVPSPEELEANPRARSAKLRIAEKLTH